MDNRIMIKLNVYGELLDIRTFSAKTRSPHRFTILRSELAQLKTQTQTILVSDLSSFAKMWLERMSDQETFLHIDFTWLSSFGKHGVSGFQEHVCVPYDRFRGLIIDSSIDCQPRRLLSVSNTLLRHKLGLFLDQHFRWHGCNKVILTDEWIPYSFAFQSYTSARADICGGVILHQQEDLRTAYYSIHT